MTRLPTVDAVIVSYNVRDILVETLVALERDQQEAVVGRVVVVDHGSVDDTISVVRSRFPTVVIVEGANRGYGAGVNRGIAETVAPYVLALNADAAPLPSAVRELATVLDTHPWVGIA